MINAKKAKNPNFYDGLGLLVLAFVLALLAY